MPNPAFERDAAKARRPSTLLQGLPQIFNRCCVFFSFPFPHHLIYIALPQLCKKVKDCETTNGHIGLIARTLMKDAHRGLHR